MAHTINLPDNLFNYSMSSLWLETVQMISIRMLWARPATTPALKSDVPSAVNVTQLMKRKPAVYSLRKGLGVVSVDSSLCSKQAIIQLQEQLFFAFIT